LPIRVSPRFLPPGALWFRRPFCRSFRPLCNPERAGCSPPAVGSRSFWSLEPLDLPPLLLETPFQLKVFFGSCFLLLMVFATPAPPPLFLARPTFFMFPPCMACPPRDPRDPPAPDFFPPAFPAPMTVRILPPHDPSRYNLCSRPLSSSFVRRFDACLSFFFPGRKCALFVQCFTGTCNLTTPVLSPPSPSSWLCLFLCFPSLVKMLDPAAKAFKGNLLESQTPLFPLGEGIYGQRFFLFLFPASVLSDYRCSPDPPPVSQPRHTPPFSLLWLISRTNFRLFEGPSFLGVLFFFFPPLRDPVLTPSIPVSNLPVLILTSSLRKQNSVPHASSLGGYPRRASGFYGSKSQPPVFSGRFGWFFFFFFLSR